MKVFPSEIKRMVESIPTGYYSGFRIPLTTSETEETSYFCPAEGNIVISIPIILKGLESIDDSEQDYKETAVRSMVFHEVSHAMLTPTNLSTQSYVNIGEDERIETVTQHIFHDVDYERNKRLINKFDPSTPREYSEPIQMFYDIIRFHYGRKDLVEEGEEIIQRYLKMNLSHGDRGSYDPYGFQNELCDLFDKVKKLFKGMPSVDGKRSTKYIPDLVDGESKNSIGSGEEIESEQEGESGLVEASQSAFESAKNYLTETHNAIINGDFYLKLTKAIENFNKRNNSGSSICGYSGVFNPRLVRRDDYKFFDKKCPVNGANKFGSMHLNLFIDTSGSMSMNMPKVNEMLSCLALAEKTYHNFTYSVITCSVGQKIQTEKHLKLVASGGNFISRDIFNQFSQIQKPNTANYNIALFDGDAFSDMWASAYKTKDRRANPDLKNFRVFDRPNCTVISDYSNQSYAEGFHSGHCIFTYNYIDEFLSKIAETLAIAFR